jgi:hypothetical protein
MSDHGEVISKEADDADGGKRPEALHARRVNHERADGREFPEEE